MIERIELTSYYFSLDCSWTNDPKIQLIIEDYNYLIATSVYVTIISMLYQEKGVLSKRYYNVISKRTNCDIEIIKNIIENYDLFFFDGEEFSSHRVIKDMKFRLSQTYRAKKKINKL